MGWWGKAWTLTEVQAFLGHADQATTERYIHVRPELVFRAAEGTTGPRDARETLPLNENGARLVERDEAAGSKGSEERDTGLEPNSLVTPGPSQGHHGKREWEDDGGV
jgi:hypothetical protein